MAVNKDLSQCSDANLENVTLSLSGFYPDWFALYDLHIIFPPQNQTEDPVLQAKNNLFIYKFMWFQWQNDLLIYNLGP